MPAPRPGPPQWKLQSYVLERADFNEMRSRLPRATRREIEPARDGHVGLVVQAIAGDSAGTPLAVLYDNVPAFRADGRLTELADQLAEMLA